jgi:hypothetical protein
MRHTARGPLKTATIFHEKADNQEAVFVPVHRGDVRAEGPAVLSALGIAQGNMGMILAILGPTGQPFSTAVSRNGWPVGPNPRYCIHPLQGVALGWENCAHSGQNILHPLGTKIGYNNSVACFKFF